MNRRQMLKMFGGFGSMGESYEFPDGKRSPR